MLLKWIFQKEDMMVRTGFIWLRIGTTVKSCEKCNKRWNVMRGDLEQLLKKVCSL
jgi:hypothetical protein